MAAGVYNPFDDARTTAVAPAHVLHAAGIRKFFDDALDPVPHSQDFNLLWQQLYAAGDYYGAPDVEGDVNYIRTILQTLVDNSEWTVSGASGTADISAKKGLKGNITAIAATGLASFGAVQAKRTFLIYYSNATPRLITPSATIATPNNMPLFVQTGDYLLVIGAEDGTKYRVVLLPATVYSAPGEPIVTNGDFEIWQENTTFTLAANTTTFLADGFKGRRAATGMVVSRQAGFSGGRYCMRVQRTVGDTSTSPLIIAYQVPTQIAQQLAGKPLLVTFDLRLGTDAVTAVGAGATIAPAWSNGAGIDESPSLVNGAFGTPNGPAQGATFAGGYTASAVATRVMENPFILTAASTESLFRLIYTPIATAAGANEYFEIENLDIKVGQIATPFVPEPAGLTLTRAQRRYRKTFIQATPPAQNAGANTSEMKVPLAVAGAVAGTLFRRVEFDQEMAATPAVTLYNPNAANALLRNQTKNTDAAVTAAANITAKSYDITFTGLAAWAIADIAAIHAVADCRL